MFKVVQALRQMPKSRITQFSQLAIAFAVVWDSDGLDEKQLQDAFAYFTDASPASADSGASLIASGLGAYPFR